MLTSLPLAFSFGPMEMTLIAAVGLLLFGKRLPEVGKSVARGIVEFKRGLKDLNEDVEDAANRPANRIDADAPKPLMSETTESETVSR